mmetsp:Transcript_6088/g.7734  ORF Transcript_6088/g.7734 Transcript_6088/m.7734 type:complete len:228 (-) Transcript_6088:88-771(-)
MSATSTSIPSREMESLSINPEVHPNESSSLSTSQNKNIHVESFTVAIPKMVNGIKIMDLMEDNDVNDSKSVVGTVTFFNKSAMVWIGWGESYSDEEDRVENPTSNGKGVPMMGPMVVSMPRSKYAGLGSDFETPCSQLISGPNEEEMMLGFQMASRLSRKCSWPIFVSSSLHQIPDNSGNSGGRADCMDGLEDMNGSQMFGNSLVIHAAALAEKKVCEIILNRQKKG